MNIENSIRKTPKWYQRDWCEVADENARFENLVACHLFKAIDMWNDLGLGDYAIYYIRNKAKEDTVSRPVHHSIPTIHRYP